MPSKFDGCAGMLAKEIHVLCHWYLHVTGTWTSLALAWSHVTLCQMCMREPEPVQRQQKRQEKPSHSQAHHWRRNAHMHARTHTHRPNRPTHRLTPSPRHPGVTGWCCCVRVGVLLCTGWCFCYVLLWRFETHMTMFSPNTQHYSPFDPRKGWHLEVSSKFLLKPSNYCHRLWGWHLEDSSKLVLMPSKYDGCLWVRANRLTPQNHCSLQRTVVLFSAWLFN